MKKSIKGLHLKQIAQEVGIPYQTLAARIITKCMTLAEALAMPKRAKKIVYTKPTRPLVYDHLGNSYLSISAMTRAWGIARGTYIVRISLGWTLEQALTTPVRGATSELMQLAREHHISYNVLYQRVNAMHWTLEQALTTPVNQRDIPARDHLNNSYRSISAMARAYKLSPCVLLNRLDTMTLEEALTAPKRKSGEGLAVADHLGNIYPTFQAMCDAYKSPDARVRRRLAKGWTLEQALTTPQMHLGRPTKK